MDGITVLLLHWQSYKLLNTKAGSLEVLLSVCRKRRKNGGVFEWAGSLGWLLSLVEEENFCQLPTMNRDQIGRIRCFDNFLPLIDQIRSHMDVQRSHSLWGKIFASRALSWSMTVMQIVPLCAPSKSPCLSERTHIFYPIHHHLSTADIMEVGGLCDSKTQLISWTWIFTTWPGVRMMLKVPRSQQRPPYAF